MSDAAHSEPALLTERDSRVSTQRVRKRRIFNDLLRLIAVVLDFDGGTKLHHASRVALLARSIGSSLGLDPDLLFYAGLIHDIGAVGLSDDVVHHARIGPVRADVRQHPIRGARLLRPLTSLHELAGVIAHHHERWDGSGFPEGLSGTSVPIEASVVCLADLLEVVLRDVEPDRRAERALRFTLSTRGTSVAPEAAEATLRLLISRPGLLDEIFDDEAADRAVRLVDAEPAALLRMTEEELLAQLLWVVARVVDGKHVHSVGHSARVAVYARQIALRLGDTVDPWEVVWTALLHDTGMVAIPQEVLRETSLDDEARAFLHAHAVHTRDIVSSAPSLARLALAASSNHEAWDGSGYPQGLAKEAIPLIARIIAYADIYDGFSTDRPDRPAYSPDDALAEVRKRVGTLLDPNLAEAALLGLSEPENVYSASSDLLGYQQFFESFEVGRQAPSKPAPLGEKSPLAKWHTLHLDTDGRVRFGAAALHTLSGVVATPLADHLQQASHDRLRDEMARAYGGETVSSVHRALNGSEIELLLGPLDNGLVALVRHASPVRSMRDVALVHRNFVGSSEAVCFTDAGAHIVDVNSAFTRLFGWRADEVIGKTPKILQSGLHPSALYREMRESLADPGVGAWSGELINVTRSGEHVVVHLSINALRDPSGGVVGYVSTALDITARRRAQQALEERERELLLKNEQLSRLNQFKSQMVAITSHDLRAPLAFMISIAELLQENQESIERDSTRARLGMIADAGYRLVRLVNDLLDLDKCESGTLKLRARSVSPAGIVRSVASTVSTEERRPVRAASESARIVMGDADRLEQALLNLTRNAVRFSPEPSSVEVGCDLDDPDRIVFWVADRGPGIPHDLLESVFDRYVQVDREGAAEAYGVGMGLGLAIVRHIAQLHGGRAWAENRRGGGCRFVLELPVLPVDAPRTALLLGPSSNDLDRASKIFSRNGLLVFQASRDEEACRRLAIEAPAVLLIDTRWAKDRLDADIAQVVRRCSARVIALHADEPTMRDPRFDWELVTPLMDLEIASLARVVKTNNNAENLG